MSGDATGPGTPGPAEQTSPGAWGDYLAAVQAEIQAEVERRRADVPVRVERELDELFLEHAPVAGREGELGEILDLVDSAAFIDPVVPVASNHAGGALAKKALRSLHLWYMGYVTHQVSQFAARTSRALRLLDGEMTELRRRLDAQRVPPPPLLDGGGRGSWWASEAVTALDGSGGRVVHMVCGDGSLVAEMVAKGIDAYGVDPRQGVADGEGEIDLREEDPLEHLEAVAPAALAGAVVSGVVDGMTSGQRDRLLAMVLRGLADHGVLVVHSTSPAGWAAPGAPPEADLAAGHPLRPGTWRHLLAGFDVEVHDGPRGLDYLVVARR